MPIEYITADGHLTDPRDGVTVRTNWDSEAVQAAIDHLTPTFEKTRPIAVFAGFSRYSVDDMNIVVFWRRENLRKNKAVNRAEEKWAVQRHPKNQFMDVNNFPLSRMGLVRRRQSPDWNQVMESFSMSPSRYRQIWPPQPAPSPQQ